jgi:exosome complex component MTR3
MDMQAQVGGQLLLDPGSEEVAKQEAGLSLALMPTTNQVAQLVSSGAWGGQQQGSAQLQMALELAMGGCAQLDAAARECLRAAAAAASTGGAR